MTLLQVKTTVSRKRLFWTIIFNAIITAAEFIGGFISGYLALIADAVHNLADVAALGLAWLGVKGSELPATKKSTYGYKRIEVMTALISAVSLVVIAIFIFKEAFERMITPQPITRPEIFLTVAVIGLLGNILSMWLLNSEKGKSLNMKAAFLHMFYDALSSVAVVIGGIVILLTGWYMLDTILACMIGLMIFYSSYLVIKEAVLIFMESVPAGIDFDEVLSSISDIARVKEVHDLHIWSLSSNEISLSCHVCLSRDDYLEGSGVIMQINEMLRSKFNIGHGTFQLEIEGQVCPDIHSHGNELNQR
jgi:cobalt-zinc-cadmium efflux system protein